MQVNDARITFVFISTRNSHCRNNEACDWRVSDSQRPSGERGAERLTPVHRSIERGHTRRSHDENTTTEFRLARFPNTDPLGRGCP